METQKHWADGLFRLGESVVDFKKGTASRAGEEIALETKELGVLKALVEHPGELVTYEIFRERVWDGIHVEIEANVQTRVSNLRSKLGVEIKNHRAKGYVLQTPVEPVTQQEPLPVPEVLAPLPISTPSAEKVSSSDPPAPNSDHRAPRLETSRRSKPLVISLFVGLVILTTGLTFYWFTRDERLPSDFVIEGQVLTVFDQHQRFFWDYQFPEAVSPTKLLSFQCPHKFVNLEGNGHIGLIVGAHSLLYYFDRRGKVVWKYKPGRETLTLQGNTVPGNYFVSLVDTLSHPRPDGGRIVVGSHRGPGALFVVELLTKDGHRVDEYFHYGWFFVVKTAVFAKDGHENIFLGGVDDASGTSSDYGATLVILDPGRMFGQATTMAAKPFAAIQGVPAAREQAVVLIKEFARNPNPSIFCHGQDIEIAGGFLQLLVDQSGTPRAYFTFDRNLKLHDVLPELILQNILRSTILRDVPEDQRKAVTNRFLGQIMYIRNEFAEGN